MSNTTSAFSVKHLAPLSVAVGTTIADRPPQGSARALVSACGSYRGSITAKRTACPHPRPPVARANPLCVGYVLDGRVFSLISSLPSSLSADSVPSLFE
jgi:hypothetical protein